VKSHGEFGDDVVEARVMLQILGKHEMLIKGWQDAPKRKLVSAFRRQSVSCYAQRRAGVNRKATIADLQLGECL
jgi:hypothetical protein